MAIAFDGTADSTVRYEDVLTDYKTETYLWGGFWAKWDDISGDGVIFSLADLDYNGYENTMQVQFDFSIPNGIQLYQKGNGASIINSTSPVDSYDTAGVWVRILWTLQMVSTTNAIGTLYFNGTAGAAFNRAVMNGTLEWSFDNHVTLGMRQTSATGDLRIVDGAIEDVFICKGALPTSTEITDLQTKSADRALASSNSEIIFHPDLIRDATLADRISGTEPVSVALPSRFISKDVVLGRDPTIMVLGDPQYSDSTEWALLRDQVLAYKTALNITAVHCVGDWVDQSSTAEAVIARNAVDAWIAGGLAVYGPPGNHDIEPNAGRQMTDLNVPTGLPSTLFSGQATFDELMSDTVRSAPVPRDTDLYTYSTFFTAQAANDWLYICLPMWPTLQQLDWTVAKCAEYPDKNVIIGTHAFLNSTGHLYSDKDTAETDQNAPGLYTTDPGNNPGASIEDPNSGWWNSHLAKIPNLAIVTGGHAIYSNSTRKTAQTLLVGNAGNTVMALYVNNQNVTDGGAGFSTILEMHGGSVSAFSMFVSTDAVWDGRGNAFDYTIRNAPAGVLTDTDIAAINAAIEAGQVGVDAAAAKTASESATLGLG